LLCLFVVAGCGHSKKPPPTLGSDEISHNNEISQLFLLDYKKMKANYTSKWKGKLMEARLRVEGGEGEEILEMVEKQVEDEKAKVQQETAIMNADCLEKIWNLYDKDENGRLDKVEVTKLMKVVLRRLNTRS